MDEMVKYVEKEIDGEIYLVKTKEWEQAQAKALLDSYYSASGLPLHAKNLSLKDYIGNNRSIPRKLTKYIREFDKRYKNVHLYFWSHENGTQKTTTASIVGKELIVQGKVVRFILMGELLSLLTDLDRKEGAKERREDLLHCDFLIIDDSFDRKKATIYRSGYQISFLDIFLRERLEILKKATCFTSNFSLEEIDEEVFGVSLKKLVRRSVLDPFEFTTLYSDRNDFDVSDLWS